MIRIALPGLAFLLLGAHFYRSGVLPGTYLCIGLTALLIVPHRWVPRVATIGLFAGTFEWLRTLYVLASARISLELPWLRLAAILGAVVLLTALSTLVFRDPRLRRFYGRG